MLEKFTDFQDQDHASQPPVTVGSSPLFSGYNTPSSNTTYVPNQFFDVLLPNSSRGVVRLVSYILRRSLGWSDEQGNPIEQHVSVTYKELISSAGISRGALPSAIDEAIQGNFIQLIQQGAAKSFGSSGASAVYEIKWDNSSAYTTSPSDFAGFFSGEGCRTYIPNAFFDYTIKNEPLSVCRVVGAIIRNTIGFTTKFGFRRQEVQLSFRQLETLTNLSRKHLNSALKQALENQHIKRTKCGVFSPSCAENNRPATYSLCWSSERQKTEERAIGSKRKLSVAALKNCQSKKETEIGSKRKLGSVQKGNPDRFKKETHIEIKHLNKTFKQQTIREKEFSASTDENAVVDLLIRQGFTKAAAVTLADSYSGEHILNQIEWFPLRSSARNPLGMLRRAIEENWDEPRSAKQSAALSPEGLFVSVFYAAWAGNKGKPIAMPTSQEVAIAGTVISRILENPRNPGKVAENLGKRFGSFVRARDNINFPLPRSLAAAVRAFGDEFIAFEDKKKERLGKEQQKRKATTVVAKKTYGEFSDEFLSFDSKQRREIENMPMLGSETIKTILSSFDAQQQARYVKWMETQELS